MATIKSIETLLSELRTFLRAYNSRLDTGNNSLSKDLVLTPMSIAGRAIMQQIEIARDLSILSKNTGGELDDRGTDYKLEREAGDYATVVLTFYSNTEPTDDITIQANVQASTAGTTLTSPITFSTIASSLFRATDAASYFSYDRDRYEFNVIALCDTIGEAGNVGSELINNIVGNIEGIDGVTNLTAASGGRDEEEDDDIRARIQLKMTGRDLNTTNGLRKFVKDNGFLDGYPVRCSASDAEKATGIDVFVIDSSSESVSEDLTYDPSQDRYYLTNRPVREITSVVGSSSGNLGASDYTAYIDDASSLRRSIYAQDYIRFSPGVGLVTGETITITYNYSSLIAQVQATLDLISNDILTADPLLKRAIPLYFYMNATLTLKSNADGPTTRNRVKNALAQYMATYRLGDDLQKSDLIVVMQEGYGDYPIDTVDAVIINNYYLQDTDGNQRSATNEVISVGNKEYIVYGSTTIT